MQKVCFRYPPAVTLAVGAVLYVLIGVCMVPFIGISDINGIIAVVIAYWPYALSCSLAIAGLVFLYLYIKSISVCIDENGFTYRSMLKGHTIRWEEIARVVRTKGRLITGAMAVTYVVHTRVKALISLDKYFIPVGVKRPMHEIVDAILSKRTGLFITDKKPL